MGGGGVRIHVGRVLKQDGHMCVSGGGEGGGLKTRGPDSAASGQMAPQISRSLHTAHARCVLCDGKAEARSIGRGVCMCHREETTLQGGLVLSPGISSVLGG